MKEKFDVKETDPVYFKDWIRKCMVNNELGPLEPSLSEQ